MKLFVYACLIITAIVACNASEQKPDLVKMNAKDIKPGPVVHDTLSSVQMEKIQHIQKTFSEVYPVSLDETVTNFKRDHNPGKEIAIWLNMASVYENFINKNPGIEPVKKQEAFALLLLRSMMTDEEAVKEAKLQVLSKEEINWLLQNYKLEAFATTNE